MLDQERQAIITVLDREKAWAHVIMNYIEHVRNHMGIQYSKSGLPNRRHHVGRIMFDLNSAIGDAMLITDPSRPELEESQDELLAAYRRG